MHSPNSKRKKPQKTTKTILRMKIPIHWPIWIGFQFKEHKRKKHKLKSTLDWLLSYWNLITHSNTSVDSFVFSTYIKSSINNEFASFLSNNYISYFFFCLIILVSILKSMLYNSTAGHVFLDSWLFKRNFVISLNTKIGIQP